jgi:hypothetical protein
MPDRAVPRIISVHEYELRPDVRIEQFEQALRDARRRGLLQMPGLVETSFLRGIRGSRRGKYAALWTYQNLQVWEQLWGPIDRPRQKTDYPSNWRIWEDEVLTPFLAVDPDSIEFSAYQEF